MNTKLKSFFVLLSLILGGVSSVWADDLTFSFSAFLGNTAGSPTISTSYTGDNTIDGDVNLYFKFNSSEVPAGTNIEVSGTTYYYAKMNNDADFYEVSGYTFKKGDVVTVFLYTKSNTIGYCVGSKKHAVSASRSASETIDRLSYTLTANDIEDNGNLRIYRNSSNTYFAGMTVTGSRTITNYTTQQSYPYTWDFTDATAWASSETQMTTGSDGQWRQIIPETTVTEYRPTAAKSNWGYNVDLLKGLIFSATSRWKPCLDKANKQCYVNNGTSIIIPGLTVGQRIQVTGNVTIGTVANTTSADDTYTVTTAGNITIPFTADSWIKTIKVLNPDDGTVEYPYAWDLTTWTTNLSNNTNYWGAENPHGYTNAGSFSNGAAVLTSDGSTFIPEIKGLKFLPGQKDGSFVPGRIVVDQTAGYIKLGAGCQVVIPNTTAGQIIYIDGYIDGNKWGGVNVTNADLITGSWDVANEKSDKFYVSTGGDVTITMNSNHMYLYHLAVNNSITVNSSDPSNGATGVAVTKKPTLTTNYSVSTVALTVTDENDNPVSGTSSISNNKITFTPSANLDSWTTYTMTVPVGGIVQKIEKDPYKTSNISTNPEPYSVTFTTTGLELDKTFPINNGEIVGSGNLPNNSIQVWYKANVSSISEGRLISEVTISDGTTVTPIDKLNNTLGSKEIQLNCPVPLESGKTYRVTIPKGLFTTSTGLANDLYTFSFHVDATEPGIQMVIPATTTDVSVATRIVVNSDDTNKLLDLSEPFTATLEGGGSTMVITATAEGPYSGWSFKPETALTPNTTYTLTIPANTMVTQNGTTITAEKVFTFSTVASTSGTAPVLQKTSGTSSPYENEVIADFKNGTVTLKFDQNISLVDGTKIDIIPIGGSEYNTRGEFYTHIGDTYNNKITVSGDHLSFAFSNTDMHYDLYYRVILPANVVLGEGGKPNVADEYVFKVSPTVGYRASDNYDFASREGYPYTWDFSYINTTDANAITGNSGKWRTQTGDGQTYYARQTYSDCFCKELLDNNTKVLDDFRGLRIGTKRNNSSYTVRIFDPQTNGSGYMRIHGNTHYMTIPNVPISADAENGEHYLYIRARVSSNGVLALNTPSSIAEWVGDAPSNTDGQIKVYKVRVKVAGDIPFVCSDVNFYQIAFSTYNKPLSPAGEGYATDCHNYNNSNLTKGTDYAMTETLGGGTLTPYYVSSVDPGTSSSAGTVTLTRINNGVPANTGVVLLGTAGQSYPLFVTAYSKDKPEITGNFLTGVPNVTTVLTQEVNPGTNPDYYYVLNNNYQKVVGGDGDDSENPLNKYGTGIGFYLIRGGESLTIYRYAAYMILNTKSLVQGGQVNIGSEARGVYFFKFEDGTGSEHTAINDFGADDVKVSLQSIDDAYYDLRGQRVTNPLQPGLYIHRGKKIVVK